MTANRFLFCLFSAMRYGVFLWCGVGQPVLRGRHVYSSLFLAVCLVLLVRLPFVAPNVRPVVGEAAVALKV